MDKRNVLFNVRIEIVVCLIIVMTLLFTYWPIRHFEFVNFDDDIYVYNNYHIQKGLNAEFFNWAFNFKIKNDNFWHPLTWLSHAIDYNLYGLDPGKHHVTSLIFHIFNSLLLFLVLKRMCNSLWQSAFVAFIFALHPINVNTVVWIAQRKNVLSTFFWFITLFTYVQYTEKPGVIRYLFCLLLFAFGLMSKPMLVTLPFTLLLLDYWPLQRLAVSSDQFVSAIKQSASNRKWLSRAGTLILEKIPFILLSLVMVFISMHSTQRIVASKNIVPLSLRIANGVVSYKNYIFKLFWPENLAVFYPFPDHIPAFEIILSGCLLLNVSTLMIYKAKSAPYLVTGWLWFLGTLFPVIGLIQVGLWPAMADRWAYIPFIGLFIILAWAIPELMSKLHTKRIFAVITTIIIFLMMINSMMQVRHWTNSVTLFQNTIKNTDNNFSANLNLASALIEQGRSTEAQKYLNKAIQIKPESAKPYMNMGVVMANAGDYKKAIEYYEKAVGIDPNLMANHNNLGVAFAAAGNMEEAIDQYKAALKIAPDAYELYNNLGVAYATIGKIDEAVNSFKIAVKINPAYSEAFNNLGLSVIRKGLIEEAISYFSQALWLRPGFIAARNNLHRAKSDLERIQKAASEVHEALQIDPLASDVDLKVNELTRQKLIFIKIFESYRKSLPTIEGSAQIKINDLLEGKKLENDYIDSFSEFREILVHRPESADVYYHMACIYAIQKNIREAVNHLKKAMETGFNQYELLRMDSDLENIRETEFYNSLINSKKSDR